MSSSLDTAASKKYGPTTDRAKGGAEEALLRLEEGLRDAGLRAALLVLGQSPERASQTPSESPPRQRSGAAQLPGAAFLTEEAVVRLEEGLRAQREQQAGRRFFEPDAASGGIRADIDAVVGFAASGEPAPGRARPVSGNGR